MKKWNMHLVRGLTTTLFLIYAYGTYYMFKHEFVHSHVILLAIIGVIVIMGIHNVLLKYEVDQPNERYTKSPWET